MPNSSVAITPGAGANIAVNAVAGLDMQVVKADWGGDGASIPASSDGTHGLDVHVKLVDGVVTVNNPTPGNLQAEVTNTVAVSAESALPVSAPANAPVAVQLSDGTDPLATLPVSGQVQANQGDGSAATPWSIFITDGENGDVQVSTVSGQKALNVNVLESASSGDVADDATFTEGTTLINPIGGEYNTAAGAVTSGKAAACQISQYRGLHVNLRTSAGAEIGLGGAPVYVQPTGSGTQPVSGTVAANLDDTTNAGAPVTELNYNTAGTEDVTVVGIALPANGGPVAGGTATNPIRVDPVGTTTQPVNVGEVLGEPVSAANPLPTQPSVGNAAVSAVSAGGGNPLPVLPQPTPSGFWKAHVVVAANQTSQAIHTPASGKTAYVESLQVLVSAGAGLLEIYDSTNTAATRLWAATVTWAYMTQIISFARPIPLSAVNNILRYDSGADVVGDITVMGYDA